MKRLPALSYWNVSVKGKQATTNAVCQSVSMDWVTLVTCRWKTAVSSDCAAFTSLLLSHRNTWRSWPRRVCRGPSCLGTAAPPVLTKGKSPSVCTSGAVGWNVGPKPSAGTYGKRKSAASGCWIVESSRHQFISDVFLRFFFSFSRPSLSSWLLNLCVIKVDSFSFGTAVCSGIFSNCPSGQQCESVVTLMSSV